MAPDERDRYETILSRFKSLLQVARFAGHAPGNVLQAIRHRGHCGPFH